MRMRARDVRTPRVSSAMRNLDLFSLLGQLWDDFNRMHRGGLGESPRGLADHRRNRRIVAAVLVVVGAAAVVASLLW